MDVEFALPSLTHHCENLQFKVSMRKILENLAISARKSLIYKVKGSEDGSVLGKFHQKELIKVVYQEDRLH